MAPLLNSHENRPLAPVLQVGTVAAGMGLDRGDVRLVVHYNLPATLEVRCCGGYPGILHNRRQNRQDNKRSLSSHACFSGCHQGFYQESGRAGRDGLPSRSVVLFSERDRSAVQFLLSKDDKARSRQASSRTRSASPFALAARGASAQIRLCW